MGGGTKTNNKHNMLQFNYYVKVYGGPLLKLSSVCDSVILIICGSPDLFIHQLQFLIRYGDPHSITAEFIMTILIIIFFPEQNKDFTL